MTGLVLAIALMQPPSVQDSCKTATLLPAYAHNDYRNKRPLRDALALGYRGVEADVFRVGNELVVAHDRSDVRLSRTLRSLYLAPLETRRRRCGYILADSTPFYLNIELKEADSTAFRYLVEQLRQFEDLFRSAVRVTLVGWWPKWDAHTWPDYLRVQLALDRRGVGGPTGGAPVGFVSLDYGKSLKWSGKGTVPLAAQEILAAAHDSAAARAVPVRVPHAPVNAVVYRWLRLQGVALIGTSHLSRTRSIFER